MKTKTFIEKLKLKDEGLFMLYDVGLKNNAFEALLKIFKLLNKDVLSVPLVYLGLDNNVSFEKYCKVNNLYLVKSNNINYLRFD